MQAKDQPDTDAENTPESSEQLAKPTAGAQGEMGFEKEIWRAIDMMRGNLDASEYKHVILGLIFLKYISDRFDTRRAELEAEFANTAEKDSFINDRDEYIAQGVAYVPPNARWPRLQTAAHSTEIGSLIDTAMIALEKENRQLRGILPKNFSRPELDQRRLGEVVLLFSNIQMRDEQGPDKDILGRVYEYCLQKFAEAEGKNAGEFYTPSCVVRTIVEVLEPFQGRVYDPCCGSGGMFVQSAKFIQEHSYNIDNISVYGQDANPTTRKLALMNLAIHGVYSNLGTQHADTFFQDLHPRLKADYIMANPPFNLGDWGASYLADDLRWRYGLPPESNANYAWIQHIIHHLSPTGRAGVVLANGSLSSLVGAESEIRRRLIEDDLVECIVSMPAYLFYSTQISVCLWFFNRSKPESLKNKTLFIDAHAKGKMITRKHRELEASDISKIASTVHQFYAPDFTSFQAEKGFSGLATLDEIAAQDYILTPGRYVELVESEEETEPFELRMARLSEEFRTLCAQSRELEQLIEEKLASLGDLSLATQD